MITADVGFIKCTENTQLNDRVHSPTFYPRSLWPNTFKILIVTNRLPHFSEADMHESWVRVALGSCIACAAYTFLLKVTT